MVIHRPEHIVVLTSTPTEMAAGIIVATLEENGIKAHLTGETTAGFRAEAPGWVQVLVAAEDAPRARAILDEVRRDENDVNWSAVDVGEPDEVLPESTPWWASLSLWRRLGFFLVVLSIIWVVASLGAEIVGLIVRAIGFRP